jgi:Fe2+ or Zn2+ uptake regulation protein
MIPNKSGPTTIDMPPPLRARGKRLTQPRRIILDTVRASDGHPSAATVHQHVRRRLPRVSLAPVYRNLRMLAAEGLLIERADLAGRRFDGNTAPHDHFTCVACGRIYDIPALEGGAAPVRRRARRRRPDRRDRLSAARAADCPGHWHRAATPRAGPGRCLRVRRAMRPITGGEILDLAEYEKVRAARRQAVIAIKADRRVVVGRYLSFVFENRETVWFQIQEMVRAERIVAAPRIADEVERFALPHAARRAFADAEVALDVDHPAGQGRTVLTPATRGRLAEDLA